MGTCLQTGPLQNPAAMMHQQQHQQWRRLNSQQPVQQHAASQPAPLQCCWQINCWLASSSQLTVLQTAAAATVAAAAAAVLRTVVVALR